MVKLFSKLQYNIILSVFLSLWYCILFCNCVAPILVLNYFLFMYK